jgi:Cu(I)/Ag(I) efflux system protein CusF
MKRFIQFTPLCAIAASFLFMLPGAQAQEAHQHHDDVAASAPATMSTGEVVKVDKELGKITLRHGPLANLNMPGMTMAFKVAQPAMLDQVKPGDQVQFMAEKAGGALTITALQGAN